MKKFDIELQTRNAIEAEKNSLTPHVFSQEIKTFVPYSELIKDTVCGILESMNKETEVGPSDILLLEAKTGIDGSGSHRARHQLVNIEKSLDEKPHLDPTAYKKIILSCVCPLSLRVKKPEQDDTVLLWKNPVPNAISYNRPLCLVRASETREVIESEFDSLFQTITEKRSVTVPVAKSNIKVEIDNTVSMIDGKMVSLLQGDSGAPCHYCSANKADINSRAHIIQGFSIDKSFETCSDSWRKISEGEISWSDKERAGQCHPPLVPVGNFSILHWKLRSFDFALTLLYRLSAGAKKLWVRKIKMIYSWLMKQKRMFRRSCGRAQDCLLTCRRLRAVGTQTTGLWQNDSSVRQTVTKSVN